MPHLPPIYHNTNRCNAEAARLTDVNRLQRMLQSAEFQQSLTSATQSARTRTASASGTTDKRKATDPSVEPVTVASHSASARLPPSSATGKPKSPRRPQSQQTSPRAVASSSASASRTNPSASQSRRGVKQPFVIQTDGEGKKIYKAVAFVDLDDNVKCPECGVVFSIHQDMAFRQHVFDCRRDRGSDPLMPLQIVRKSHATVPRDEFASVVRPIQATMMAVDLFSNVPMSAKRSDKDATDSKKAAVKKWTKTLAASSGQLFTLQAPPSSPQRRLADHGTSERMESDVNDALRITIQNYAATIASPTSGPSSSVALVSSPTTGPLTLNLAKLLMPYRQANRLASILAPQDDGPPMPVRVIDLTKARFIGEESAQVFFAAVMKSTTVERIITGVATSDEESENPLSADKPKTHHHSSTTAGDESVSVTSSSNAGGLGRHLAKTRFNEATINAHLASNVSGRADDDQNREFLSTVNNYHLEVENFQANANEIANKVRQFAAKLQQEEMDARKGILRALADAKAADDRRLQRIALKKALAEERVAFAHEEALRRNALSSFAFESFTHILLELELATRVSTVEREQADYRQRLKFSERENVFRCVVIKDSRNNWFYNKRLFLEGEAAAEKGDILEIFIEELALMKKQQEQHKLVAMWRKKEREEVELVMRTEDRLREGVRKDEDVQFLTSRERFFKAIEVLVVKDRSQRSYIEDYERMRRKELENAAIIFFDTNLSFFYGKYRVLKTLSRVEVTEKDRLKAMSEVPTMHISGFQSKNNMLVFVTPTPGHDAVSPAQVFGEGIQASCSMLPEWHAALTNTERLCKKAIDDEKSAMVDYLTIIQKYYKNRADAAAIALEPVNPVEPQIKEVLLITKPTAVPSMRTVGRGGGAGQKERASAGANFSGAFTFGSSSDSPSSPTTAAPPRSSSNLATAMRNRNSMSLRAPLTAKDMFSSDPEIAAAQQEVLCLRKAWHDKLPVIDIRRAKERIAVARITLSLSDDAASMDQQRAIPCEHHLLSALAIREDMCCTLITDGKEVPLLPPPSGDLSASELDNNDTFADLTTNNEESLRLMTIGGNPKNNLSAGSEELNELSFARRTLEIILEPVGTRPPAITYDPASRKSLAPSSDDLGGSLAAPLGDGPLLSLGRKGRLSASNTVAFDEPPKFGASSSTATQMDKDNNTSVNNISTNGAFCSAGPPPKRTTDGPGVDIRAVAEALSTVLYRCSIDPSLYGSHPAISTHLSFKVELTVDVADAYAEAESDIAVGGPNKEGPNTASAATLPPSTASTAYPLTPRPPGATTSGVPAQPLPTIADLYEPLMPELKSREVTLTQTGRLEIGVIPTLFTVTSNSEALLAPKVIVEGQMDAIPVVRAMGQLQDQWVTVMNPTEDGEGKLAEIRRRDDPRNVGKNIEVIGGLCGGAVVFEVLGEGVTNFDRLSLAEENGSVRFETRQEGRTKAIEKVYINDIFFGTVSDGLAQVTQSLIPSTAAPKHGPRFTVNINASFPASLVDSSTQKLIAQLRYHNYQESPEEGERNVRVTVVTSDGARSAFDTKFEVEAIDKPTELRLPFERLLHRIPCLAVPSFMRQSVTDIPLPVFPNAIVFDEDTDRFSGGFLKLVMNNSGKGDAIALCPNSHLWNFIDEGLGIPSLLTMVGNDIIFEERVVATLKEGEVLTARQWTGERECTSIQLTFPDGDSCSVAAVQAIVRSLVFVNSNPAYNSKGHPMGAKDFQIDIQIMDNEQATKISAFVSMRGGSHTVQLLEKGAILDYKANNPPCKLGYFDLNKDSINPVNNFGGGYILATIAEGYDADSIRLKAEEGEYTLVETRKKAAAGGSGLGQLKPLPSFVAGQGANLKSATSFAPSVSNFASVASVAMGSGRFGALNTGKGEGAQSAADKIIAAQTTNFMRDSTRLEGTKPVAISFTGMNQPMATCLTFKGGLLIQFAADTKRDQIQRRHVMTILRNITYFHSGSDVKSSQKIARVMVSDSFANSPTQALVQINLEVADDVTEVRCKSPKRRILQSLENNYPLLPYGRSLVYDKDTEFFDGGSLLLQCIAGSSKGDNISFVPPHLQQGRLQRTMPTIPDLTVRFATDILYNDFTKTFFNQSSGKDLARVETSMRDGGVAEIRFTFTRNDPQVVTKDAVGYMMNSVLFGNQAERLRDNGRTFMVRIKDPENPSEGKLKLTLDVQPPLIFFQPSAVTFESFMLSRILMPISAGSGANPGSRMIVTMDRFADLKAVSGTPQLSIVVSGPPSQLSKVRLNVPVTERETGLSLKEGKNIFAPGGVLVATLDQPDQHSAIITFQATSKPALTKEKFQSLLRSVIVSNSEELETKATAPIIPAVMDGFGDYSDGGDNNDATSNAGDSPQSVSNGNNGSTSTLEVNVPVIRSTGRASISPHPPTGAQLGLSATDRDDTASLFNRTRSSVGGIRASKRMSFGIGMGGAYTSAIFPPMPSNEDDDDQFTLVVTWTIHDGSNQTVVHTRLCPKRAPSAVAASNVDITSRKDSTVEL